MNDSSRGDQHSPRKIDSLDEIKRSIVFFMVPDFSMLAFATAIEPLRLANRMAGYETYRWRLSSYDGKPVAASNGVVVDVNTSLEQERKMLSGKDRPSMVFVCAGVNVEQFENKSVFAWLREEHNRGVAVGGLCTGAYILAKAGLLSENAAPSTGKICPDLPNFSPKPRSMQTCLKQTAIYTLALGEQPHWT